MKLYTLGALIAFGFSAYAVGIYANAAAIKSALQLIWSY